MCTVFIVVLLTNVYTVFNDALPMQASAQLNNKTSLPFITLILSWRRYGIRDREYRDQPFAPTSASSS